VEQAKNRLLSQFANIEAEADQAEAEHWERSGQSFDPDWHAPGDPAEAARDHGVEFYQLLSDMHDRRRLGVVAGMYHHWDKTFRRFLVREFRWPRLVIGDHTWRGSGSWTAPSWKSCLRQSDWTCPVSIAGRRWSDLCTLQANGFMQAVTHCCLGSVWPRADDMRRDRIREFLPPKL
jgi:hypothetical protein